MVEPEYGQVCCYFYIPRLALSVRYRPRLACEFDCTEVLKHNVEAVKWKCLITVYFK